MKEKDSLGDRMKANYESRAQTHLPRRSYTVLRLDGRAFHTYTRGCVRPFDFDLMADMNATAQALCEQIQGAKLAYVQSDEISIVLTDFDKQDTDAWFDGNVQKMVSISAAMATAAFNRARWTRAFRAYSTAGEDLARWAEAAPAPAHFDSRVFTIPEREEVLNCLIWRQIDAVRNSIQMAGHAHFTVKQMQQVSCNRIQEMLFREHGINWNDYPAGAKRGRVVARRRTTKPVEYFDAGEQATVRTEPVERWEWRVEEPPTFTQDRQYLYDLIPARFQ